MRTPRRHRRRNPSRRRSRCAARAGRLRILLAEDNAINQKVVAGMLASGGHQVVVVDNGQQAVEAVQRQVFDVVLMDIQMPEMNGLEATAAIREREREAGGRLPIIAMTAHAMAGDRERCLAAGMDGYVAKPIRIADMFSTIAAVVAGEAPPDQGEAPIVDEQKLLAHAFAGNAALLADVIDAFATETPMALATMREAVEAGDLATLARAAHKMKGTVGVFTTGPALAAAVELETRGKGQRRRPRTRGVCDVREGDRELGEVERDAGENLAVPGAGCRAMSWSACRSVGCTRTPA